MPANVEKVALIGFGSFLGSGDAGNNWLVGGAWNGTRLGLGGNDALDGQAGADNLVGGSGDDTYGVGTVWDIVSEAGNAGTDTIETTRLTGRLLPLPNVENLTFISAGNCSGTGSDGNNTITGAGNFSATGNSLDNQLAGGNGKDTLDGAGGADMLLGGPGNDGFRFVAGQAQGDTVTDFAGNGAAVGGRIVLVGYGTAAQGASFVELGGGVWQVASANDLVQETITFTAAPSIHVSDYLFTGRDRPGRPAGGQAALHGRSDDLGS